MARIHQCITSHKILEYGKTRNNYIKLEQIPAFARVKNWKVLIGQLEGVLEDRFSFSWSLSNFCRAICHSAPDALEVMIIPASMESFPYAGENTGEMFQLLAPLRLLRRVGTLIIRAAKTEDIRDLRFYSTWDFDHIDTGFDTAEDPVVHSWALTIEEAEDGLVDLVTGDSPVELLFEMDRNLLNYVQTFERMEAFKLGIGLDPQKSIEMCLGPDYKPSTRRSTHTRIRTRKARKAAKITPVEQALWRANQSTWTISNPDNSHYETSASETFRKQRAMVLNFLDEYAKSFQRHSPPAFRASLLRQSRYWEKLRKEMPREQGLKKLHEMFESQDFTIFVEVFKFVCDDLDAQYLEIRRARKELFVWDIEVDKGCEIDFGLNRCDEIVDWAVNEPILFPKRPWVSCILSVGSMNFGWGWGG